MNFPLLIRAETFVGLQIFAIGDKIAVMESSSIAAQGAAAGRASALLAETADSLGEKENISRVGAGFIASSAPTARSAATAAVCGARSGSSSTSGR